MSEDFKLKDLGLFELINLIIFCIMMYLFVDHLMLRNEWKQVQRLQVIEEQLKIHNNVLNQILKPPVPSQSQPKPEVKK